MTRPRPLMRALAGFAGMLLACSCRSGSGSTVYQAEGTRKMAERLEQTLAEIDPATNPFMNTRQAEALRVRLEGTIQPLEYFNLQPEYATQLLNAGRTEEAIREYQKLRDALSQPGVEATPHHHHFIARYLAVAYLRLGEQQNCILNHSADSCLLPIKDAGVHKLQYGSTEAIKILQEILVNRPDDLEARWFLNIAYMTLGRYPDEVPKRYLIPPSAFASKYDVKRFIDVAPRLGLDVRDLAGGAVVDDFDNDGDLDIVASAQGFHSQIRFFINNSDGTFTERTKEAGLTGLYGGLNIVHADYDNDGFLDVFVLRGGWMGEGGKFPKSLLRNNGDGTFTDVTEEAGLLSFHPTQTATWFDYDGDGWLDLYVGHESNEIAVHPCELYRNNGNGTFTDCSRAAGVEETGLVKGVTSGDYNNDGRPDLYVSRRGGPNTLFRNDGPKPGASDRCAWTFTNVAVEAGVTEPNYSFPTWFFDYDNDGWLDLFVSGYLFNGAGDIAANYLGLPETAEHPRLYHNNHDGTFTDVRKKMGLDRVLHAMGCNYGDLDNDGWLDFYVGTGDPNLGSLIPNLLFRNAEGKFFQDVTTSAGVGHLQKGHGVAFADIDEDGDQDIYETMGGAFEGDAYGNVLYENPGHGNHWIKLKLQGVRTNRAAIGARLKVVVETPDGERAIHRHVTWGSSFGGSPLRQEIGLGQARSIRVVEVTWPVTGAVQTFASPPMDRAYAIREGSPDLVPLQLKTFRFAAAPGGKAAHVHH